MINKKDNPDAGYYCKLSIGFFIVYIVSLSIIIGIIAGNVFPGTEPIRYTILIVALQAILITSCILSVPYLVNRIKYSIYPDEIYREVEPVQP